MKMEKKQKLVLIDGSSVAYRAFFAMHKQLESFVNGQGLHTNAIYSFKRMLENIMENEQPTHALVAFDAGKTTFRHGFYKEYKAGRAKTPGEFGEQLPYIKELVSDFGIEHYQLVDYEADDIIGTLARQADEAGFQVSVYSGDRDLTQLASSNVTVKVTLKGVSELEEYTPCHIMEKYQLTPKQIIDMKGLAGDKSDNIPGVTKVGEKTAIKLLTEYGSVEGVYNHIDELKASKMKEHLIEDKEQALLSKRLATIDCHAPIEVTLEDTLYQGPHMEALRSLYEELDFRQFLAQMPADTYHQSTKSTQKVEFQVVENVDESMFSSDMALIIDTLGENYHVDDIIGVAWGNEQHIYVASNVDIIHEPKFKAWLESDQHKYVYDMKKDTVLLHRYGIQFGQNNDDLMIGAYLLNTINQNDDFASLVQSFGYYDIQEDEMVYGKGKKREIPEDDVLWTHLACKVKAICQVIPKMQTLLQEKQQESLYKEIELPMATVLANMEMIGVSVDSQTLKNIGEELDGRIQALQDKIFEAAGETFNLNSPKQLGVVLFEKMGLPVIKKTKTGYSTSMDVLNKLRPDAPIVDDILSYRQLAKLQSTYITGLLKQIHNDGKIHTRYLQTLTQTGRLSSVDPNLQNIPVRLEEGKKIRQAFVPSHPDWLIFSSDYSQIELRVLAAISGDENLQEAFKEGDDIHDSTARRIFHLSPDDVVTSNMRRQAKAVNFGVVYGISDYGLSENLGISRKEAAEFIETYLSHYPGVKKYMEEVVREAKDKGYVETLFHRRRYLPDINSRNFNLRSFAERTAINSPIQGSAADILKIAMIKMAERLKHSDIQANMLLQVHDEVIFEVDPNDLEPLKQLVEETMTSAVELSVPLVTDSNWGKNWYDAK